MRTLDGMRWDPEGGSIALDERGRTPDVTYTAVADVVQPTPEELRSEDARDDGHRGDRALHATPGDLPPEIAAMAERVDRGRRDRTTTGSSRSRSGSPIPNGGFVYDADVPGLLERPRPWSSS